MKERRERKVYIKTKKRERKREKGINKDRQQDIQKSNAKEKRQVTPT